MGNSFRTDQEPWIPVLMDDGSSLEVSLRDAFSRSLQIKRITGTPPEVASIFRFVLAILYDVHTPKNGDEWRAMWRDPESVIQACVDYVDRNAAYWDLFDPVYPFGQDPTIAKTEKPAFVLVYHAPQENNGIYLSHMSVDFAPKFSASQAVRGILATQSSSGSSKAGSMGPLCVRTVMFLEGLNLFESLLLNVVANSRPVPHINWQEYGRGAPSNQPPTSISQWLLWTSRRVRLIPDEEGLVVSILRSPGDIGLDDVNAGPHLVVRKDEKAGKLIALTLDPSKALWRNAHVILASDTTPQNETPLRQLSVFNRHDDVSLVSARVLGVSGSAQGPVTELWRDEQLPFDWNLVGDDQGFARMKKAIDDADYVASLLSKRLYGFAARYLQNGPDAATPDPNDVKQLVQDFEPERLAFWAEVGQIGEYVACEDFESRLRAVTPAKPDEAFDLTNAWTAFVQAAADRAYHRVIERLPASARRFRAQFERSAQP